MITHYIIEVTDRNGVKSVMRESSEGSPSAERVYYWEENYAFRLNGEDDYLFRSATVINIFTTEN